MVHSLIRLWEFKAKHAGDLPFDADEDLDIMTFDIMQAAAFGISPNDSATVRNFKGAQAATQSRAADSKIAEFPGYERVPGLLQSMHVMEKTANTVLGMPNARLFHFINNNFNSNMRKARRDKEAICKCSLLAENQQSHAAIPRG